MIVLSQPLARNIVSVFSQENMQDIAVGSQQEEMDQSTVYDGKASYTIVLI